MIYTQEQLYEVHVAQSLVLDAIDVLNGIDDGNDEVLGAIRIDLVLSSGRLMRLDLDNPEPAGGC